MEYKVEKQKGQVTINFTVPNAEWEAAVDAAYKKTCKQYKIDGFRKGHAPRRSIERYYGPTVFFDDAFNDCAQSGYTKALSENTDIIPVDSPKVDISKFAGEGADLEFSMVVTTKPEVTLGDYKGIKLEKVEYNVTEEDIMAEVTKAQEKASREVEITDRAVLDGDTVNLDYSGSVDGVKFAGGTAEKQTLVIGSNSFIPGFEAQMVGMAIGDEKDIQVKFPDEYHSEELKGKDAVFAVKVNAITAKELPEINDEFAKDTTKFDTLEEYKADIKANLEKSNEMRSKNEVSADVVDAVVANAEVEIPECMIEEELEYMIKDFEYRLSSMYQGLKMEDYFKYTNSSIEDYKAQSKPQAIKTIKTRLVMQEILKAEKLEANEEDVEKHIAKIAEHNEKTVDEIKATIDDHRMAHITNEVTSIKIMDFLVDNNEFTVVTEKTAKADEAKPVKKAAAKKTTAKKTTKKAEVAEEVATDAE